MSITVLFFGATADIAGKKRQDIDVSEGATASAVFERLRSVYPRLMHHHLHISVNQKFATGDEIIRDGDELAIFTAVSGG